MEMRGNFEMALPSSKFLQSKTLFIENEIIKYCHAGVFDTIISNTNLNNTLQEVYSVS